MNATKGNTMNKFEYDLFVIGAGSGGVRAARMAALQGLKVGIAESQRLGGTCVNIGCIPKKLFSYAAHFGDDFDDARGYGWQFTQAKFNWDTLRKNKDKEIVRLNNIYQTILQSAGVELFKGHAFLQDHHHVAFKDQKTLVRAKNILIATGSSPFKPEIEGHALGDVSDAMFDLASLPKHITIVGSGYIAVEFASIFKGLGCSVALLCRKEMFLRSFDHDISLHLAQSMRAHGIDIQFMTQLKAIQPQNDRLILQLNHDGLLSTDKVLFATGRKPYTQGIGLENVGVKLNDNGGVQVNEYFQTNVENIYAIGDVIDRVQLTPVAIQEAMIFVDNLVNHQQTPMNYQNIATAVFSNPNVASVGLSEKAARVEYAKIDIYQSTFKPLRNSLSGNQDTILIKLIVNQENDIVLGAHMVGPDAGEIIQGLAVAIRMGATKLDLDATMAIHPTTAEEFVTLREKQQ